MDYQSHTIDLIVKEVEKHKLVPVVDMENEHKGRLFVMKGYEIAGALHFEFRPDIVHITMGGDRLYITGGRGNRIFNWGFQDFDDTNEEVIRFFKVWHLVLKEVADTVKEKAA